MKIWIDADALPGAIKEIVIRAALKRRIATVFVADKVTRLPESDLLSCVTVESGPDAADRYIVEAAADGDVAVTQDVPLAAQLVRKGVTAIDPRGAVHTVASVGERLSIRNFMDDLRGAGVTTGGPAPFGPRDRQRFADGFDRVLTRALRR
jgi:uncharacterized protein YaiI (UPF0178 family)